MQSATRPMIFIATPCFGGLVSQHYMQSVISLIQYAGQAGFDAMLALLGHDSLITRSRNTLVTQFLESPASHLFFIDADISFDPRQVHEMLAFDQDVVAGIYPLKVINWDNAALQASCRRRDLSDGAAALCRHALRGQPNWNGSGGLPPASIAAADFS